MNFAEQTGPVSEVNSTFEQEVESILHTKAAITLTRVSQASAVHYDHLK